MTMDAVSGNLSWTYFVFTCLTLFVTTVQVTSGLFNVYPSNAVVVSGQQTSFVCQTDGNQAAWTVQYLNDIVCEVTSNQQSLLGGQYPDCRQERFLVGSTIITDRNHNQRRQAQLTINNTQLDDAGTYSCIFTQDRNQRGHAILAVLASAPSGESSPRYVTSGQNITHTCRVSYNSSTVLKITWNDTATGNTVSPSGGGGSGGVWIGTRLTAADRQHHSSPIEHESTLTVNVPRNSKIINPFTCSVLASTPPVSEPPWNITNRVYTWNSPAILVSYCPKDVAILSSRNSISVGTRLICQSDAHPPAVYSWLASGGGGSMSGDGNSTLTVTSLNDDVIEFRCMATNYLLGTNVQPCYASTSMTFFISGNNHQQQDIDHQPLQQQQPSSVDDVAFDDVLSSSSRPSATVPPLPTANDAVSASLISIGALRLPTTVNELHSDHSSARDSRRLISPVKSDDDDVRSTVDKSLAAHQMALVALLVLTGCVVVALIAVGVALRRRDRRHRHSRLQAISGNELVDRQLTGTNASVTTEVTSLND